MTLVTTTVMLICLKCQPTSAVEKLEVYICSHHVGPVVGSSDQQTTCQGMSNIYEGTQVIRTIHHSHMYNTNYNTVH